MERSWLQHCASKEQPDFFDEWSYLVVENALSEEQVEKMTVAINRVDAAAHGLKPHQTMANFRTIVEDGLFLDLLDNDKVFPLAWYTLGWNIQHYISHLIVYPPEAERSEVHLGSWHQDGGRPVREMERPHLRGVNMSDVTRKVIFIGYSYRWLCGLDYNNFPEERLTQCDPIRRQLMGDGVDVKGWWQPTDADVPLKTWIETRRGKEHLVDISGL